MLVGCGSLHAQLNHKTLTLSETLPLTEEVVLFALFARYEADAW